MGEKISYEKSKTIKETFEVEIEDVYNVFLAGRSSYNNTAIYKGIYRKGGQQYVVEISNNSRYIECDSFGGGNTRIDITNFFEKNNGVHIISEKSFFKHLSYAIGRIGGTGNDT